MKVGAIIPAAGSGTRMGGARKPLLEISGKTLLQHCLDNFFAVAAIRHVVVAVPAEMMAEPPSWLSDKRITIVAGGAQRAESVRAGLHALPAEYDVIVVHDAARPLVDAALIQRVLEVALTGVSATTGIQVTDTLHRTNEAMEIIGTPNRSEFWRAQTPQAFPRDVLEQAYARIDDVSGATDEAGLVARAGFPVRVVQGAPFNIKVTTPEDIPVAEAALRQRRS